MRNKKGHILQTQSSLKKGWKKIVLENQGQFLDRLNKHDGKMLEQIEKEVTKQLGDKIHMINSALKDVMVQRKIFEDKGYITRDEINKKYKELSERK